MRFEIYKFCTIKDITSVYSWKIPIFVGRGRISPVNHEEKQMKTPHNAP